MELHGLTRKSGGHSFGELKNQFILNSIEYETFEEIRYSTFGEQEVRFTLPKEMILHTSQFTTVDSHTH